MRYLLNCYSSFRQFLKVFTGMYASPWALTEVLAKNYVRATFATIKATASQVVADFVVVNLISAFQIECQVNACRVACLMVEDDCYEVVVEDDLVATYCVPIYMLQI